MLKHGVTKSVIRDADFLGGMNKESIKAVAFVLVQHFGIGKKHIITGCVDPMKRRFHCMGFAALGALTRSKDKLDAFALLSYSPKGEAR